MNFSMEPDTEMTDKDPEENKDGRLQDIAKWFFQFYCKTSPDKSQDYLNDGRKR